MVFNRLWDGDRRKMGVSLLLTGNISLPEKNYIPYSMKPGGRTIKQINSD